MFLYINILTYIYVHLCYNQEGDGALKLLDGGSQETTSFSLTFRKHSFVHKEKAGGKLQNEQ